MTGLARRRILLSALLAVAGLAAADPLAEGARLAEEARAGYAKAHGMAPCPERDGVLSEVRALAEASLAHYQGALKADPLQAKRLEAAVSELKGMLAWCERNKGEAGPSAPPAPPPPVPEAASGPPLTREEETRLGKLCADLDEAFGKARDCRDQAATYQGRIQEIGRGMDAARLDVEANPMNWPTVKIGEARWESLRDKARQNQKLICARLRECRAWEEKIRVSQSQMDAYGARAFPYLAVWAGQRKKPPSPEMADYLGRQSAKRQFSFTPVPAGAGFPAESEIPPAQVQETQELLGLLLKSTAQAADLALSLADTEAERAHVAKELADLEAHWAWRQRSTAWSPKEVPIFEKWKDGLRRELAGLARDRECAMEGQSEARKRLEALQERLGSLEPSRARVVEGWRRARKALPPEMETLLEGWIRKALKKHGP